MKGVFLVEEKFISYMKDKGLSENSWKSYLNDLRLFKKYYEDSYGEELTNLVHADVSMYSQFLHSHNTSAKTINRKIAALKQYNLFLVEQGIQNNIVIIDKDYIKIHNSMMPKEVPEKQDINKVLHTAARDDDNAERDYCFIAIDVYTGIRESEILGIRLVDLKLDKHCIAIVGKGKKYREVVVNNIVYDAINNYLKIRNEMKTDNPYLFVNQKSVNTTKPMARNYGNRLLNKYKHICKLAKLHPHQLRSYFCTNALHNAGFSIEMVAAQAGHSSLNTTKGYIGSDRESLLDLANKL